MPQATPRPMLCSCRVATVYRGMCGACLFHRSSSHGQAPVFHRWSGDRVPRQHSARRLAPWTHGTLAAGACHDSPRPNARWCRSVSLRCYPTRLHAMVHVHSSYGTGTCGSTASRCRRCSNPVPSPTQLLLHATTFECMSTYVTVRSSTPGAGLEKVL